MSSFARKPSPSTAQPEVKKSAAARAVQVPFQNLLWFRLATSVAPGATASSTGAAGDPGSPDHTSPSRPLFPRVQRSALVPDPSEGPFEREADRVADDITREPAPLAATGPGRDGDGQSLPDHLRTHFEPRLGHGLSGVQIHTGEGAAEMASRLAARAFTYGPNIVFGRGQYRPDEAAGQKLIAHELAHVVQQGAADPAASAPSPVRATAHRHVIQRLPEDEARASELRDRARALTDEQLISALEELYFRAGPEGRGRTGSGTPDAPFENYAAQLRNALAAAPPPPTIGLFGEHLAESPSPSLGTGGFPAGLVPAGPLDPLDIHPGLTESREDVAARVLPVVEAEARSRLRSMHSDTSAASLFIRGATGSWSSALPSEPTATMDALQQAAVDAVRARLAAVTVPTSSGHLRRDGGTGGFVYTARRDDADAHRAYAFGGDTALGLTSARDRRRWEIFEFVMATEGDTSAINAFDDQMVTVGAGYSARSGLAQRVYSLMPPEFHQRLFEHGIQVNDDNTFTVLDLEHGTVVTGTDAVRILQADERRLSLLINLAQSEEPMTAGTTTRTAREWMLRAQFDLLTTIVPDDVLDRWPLSTAKLAVKMHHWQPSVATWADLRTWSSGGTDVNAMASGARDAIWNFHGRPATGDFSLDEIEARFRRRAAGAGAPALVFAPRPAP